MSGTLSNDNGFSLVELMVTMVVFVFVLAAGSQIFTSLLTQFKQQSKIGETDIEGAVGLDIMRYDLANAGYGLPWNVPNGNWSLTNYLEAAPTGVAPDPNCFNDAPSAGTCTNSHGAQQPRAIVSGVTGVGGLGAGLNGSDYIAIKSAGVAGNQTGGKFTYLNSVPQTTIWYDDINRTVPSNQNIYYDDRKSTVKPKAIVLAVGNPNISGSLHELVVDGAGGWYLTYGSDADTAGFAPATATDTPNIIYAIDPSDAANNNTALRMPFNRADYYVKKPSTAMPGRCAPGTGILYKATVSHKDGSLSEMPILDCVADMKVDYWLTNASGNMITPPSHDISSLSPAQINSSLQEIRVYIVAQEGQVDLNYDFTGGDPTKVSVSTMEVYQTQSWQLNSTSGPPTSPFAFVNLKDIVGTQHGDPNYYRHYRWKLYTLVVQPNNLR